MRLAIRECKSCGCKTAEDKLTSTNAGELCPHCVAGDLSGLYYCSECGEIGEHGDMFIASIEGPTMCVSCRNVDTEVQVEEVPS